MISKIKKPVSILLSLIMVFSLFTIVPMTAQAASHNITINNAQNGSVTASVNGSTVTSAEEGSTVTLTATPNNGYRLKSISGTYKRNPYEAKSLNGTKNLTGTYFSYTATDAAGAGWKLANNSSIKITSTSKTITKLEFNISQRGNSFNVNNVSCTAGTKSLSGNTFVVSSVNTQSITLSSSVNNAGYVRFNSVKVYYNGDAVDETLSISGTGNVRTFIMPVVAEGAVTITPEFEESPKYSVTLTGGANATASGNTEQTGIVEGNSMDTVTYTANSGYYFAEFTNITNNGITAMRINETTVTVSGTPTANASITIPDAVFAHTHDFTYSASGATITATCSGAGDCDITEGLTMTISAPTGELIADGVTTFPTTLNDDYNTTAFPGTYTISYTKDGQPYDGTPTEAGDYTASVTVGTATASVSYTVAAPTYTVTWKNEDGSVIDTTTVAAGETPTYTGENPEKAEDENNTYTFAGWSPEITAVTGDAEYTATFTAVPKYDYTIGSTGYNFNDTITKGDGDTLATANGYANLFNFKLLGVQKKDNVDALSSESGKDVRFVSVINTDILKDADEYGYVFAKFNSKDDARAHCDEIQAYGDNVLTKECTTTSNTISGNYGLYNEDTNYKYVTATVNGIGDDTVAARFYIRKGSTYYYADYTNDQNQTYGVCAAAYSDLT